MYHDMKWSPSDKEVARRVYDTAIENELAEIMGELKTRASAVTTPDEMWEIEGYLASMRRKIQEKYDYRYSRLIFLFAQLLREERIRESDLTGLSEDKLAQIRHIVSL